MHTLMRELDPIKEIDAQQIKTAKKKKKKQPKMKRRKRKTTLPG